MAEHFGVHQVSGTAIIAAVANCVSTISGCQLISVNNGNEIAVIGTGEIQ